MQCLEIYSLEYQFNSYCTWIIKDFHASLIDCLTFSTMHIHFCGNKNIYKNNRTKLFVISQEKKQQIIYEKSLVGNKQEKNIKSSSKHLLSCSSYYPALKATFFYPSFFSLLFFLSKQQMNVLQTITMK